MTKTLALLLDSYRELNAKRLFWISLVISGLVVGIFAAIGLKGDSITLLWFETPIRSNALTLLNPADLYKSMFSVFGVSYWLGWVGNILALASTAGIFPDFLAAGSIDLYLSKPISRLRLFFSKYLGGLLFVTLQVSVFSLCCFILLGVRGHEWDPVIFLSIPLVVIVFSYLFSFCVLVGVLTRSTVAALLLTLLFWFCLWGIQSTETFLLLQSVRDQVHAATLDRRIAETQASLDRVSSGSGIAPVAGAEDDGANSNNPLRFFVHKHDDLQQLQAERRAITTSVQTAHSVLYAIVTVLPKTSGTTEVLVRKLTTSNDTRAMDAFEDERDNHRPRRDSIAERKAIRSAMQEDENKRTTAWFIGTSLAFEAVVIGLSAWIFCRRDY
jgi:ABC-type transport system involved in multi-copper enzyme maturation permease subunit